MGTRERTVESHATNLVATSRGLGRRGGVGFLAGLSARLRLVRSYRDTFLVSDDDLHAPILQFLEVLFLVVALDVLDRKIARLKVIEKSPNRALTRPPVGTSGRNS